MSNQFASFKDTGLNQYIKDLAELEKRVVKVGFLNKSPQKEPGGINVLQLAAIHEFGALHAGRGGNIHIPKRPFMRQTSEARREHFRQLLPDYLKQVVKRQMSLNTALGQLGSAMQGFIQETIANYTTPANALSTQRAKGRKLITGKFSRKLGGYRVRGMKGRQSNPPLVDAPLRDSGQMKNSVRWEITTNTEGGI